MRTSKEKWTKDVLEWYPRNGKRKRGGHIKRWKDDLPKGRRRESSLGESSHVKGRLQRKCTSWAEVGGRPIPPPRRSRAHGRRRFTQSIGRAELCLRAGESGQAAERPLYPLKLMVTGEIP
ncbi:hypothetical protein EVAR_58812_1 [Eumeta japonica]|uniref:Uncharacterized protein n=1 Tax=Eumeta variegata TaxID=151549 RepID=A0A4C1YM93_EUMVA|nr:hypothetical protein EVAR_58812_1 [Eumeta japonica]